MVPLSARMVLALIVGVALSLEAWVAWGYDADTPMMDKLDAYAADPGPKKDLFVLGTCLSEQTVQARLLERELGDVDVHNLATQASSSLIWYLVVDGQLPDEGVAAVVIPYGTNDLTNFMDPGESQIMDLARLRDLPEIVALTCPNAPCALDMLVRKISKAYRYRARIAKSVWVGLGIETNRDEVVDGPVGPEGATGFDPYATFDGKVVPGHGPPPEVPNVASPSAEPGPPIADLGWAPVTSDPKPERAVAYLEALVAAGERQGVPIVFVPLPRNPDYPDERHRDDIEAQRDLVERLVALGAVHLDLGHVADLDGTHYLDDSHLTVAGRELVSAALAQELKTLWSR